MHQEQKLKGRLDEARRRCVERMLETADWLERTDASVDDLRACGHRLSGTLGSFAFHDAASFAQELERSCDRGSAEMLEARDRLVTALRGLMS